MKIGIMELKTHHEVMRVYLLGFHLVEVEVYCYTTKFNHALQQDLHGATNIHWRIQTSQQSKDDFVKANQSELNQLDYLLITTHFNLQQAHLLEEVQTGLLLHGFHAYFQPTFQLLSKKDWSKFPLRLLKMPLTWFRHLRFKQSMLAVDELIVGTQSVDQYLQESGFQDTRVIRLLVMYYNEQISLPHSRTSIQIVVPGNISPVTRDYELLLRVFQNLSKNLDTNIQLIFPTRIQTKYAQSIRQRFQHLDKFIEVRFFEQYLDQAKYDQILLDADFMICPIRQYTYSGMVREWNGYSHVSATVNDVIRLGIPAIFPQHYPLPKALVPITGQYTNEQALIKLLENWLATKIYNQYKTQMPQQLRIYQANATKGRFQQFIKELKQTSRL